MRPMAKEYKNVDKNELLLKPETMVSPLLVYFHPFLKKQNCKSFSSLRILERKSALTEPRLSKRNWVQRHF